MTLNTPLVTFIGNSGSIIRKGGNGKQILVKASSGSASIFIGAWVTRTGETAASKEVDLCAVGEQPDGIILGAAPWEDDYANLNKDSDDCFADGTWLVMYIPEKGDEIAITTKTNSAITANTEVQVDGGFGAQYTFNAAGGTIQTETRTGIIGKLISAAITATAATEKMMWLECY